MMTASRRWLIIGLLCAAMIIAYFDRVSLSVALAERDPVRSLRATFQLTDRDRGALNSAFFWSYATLQVPAGWIVDRFGVKGPYALGLLTWCLVSAAPAFAVSLRQLFLLRLVLGVGQSVVTPAGMRWIRFHCTEHQRGLAVGLYMAAAKVGPALGAPLAGWLTVKFGWRQMFLILGLGGLLWLLPWMKLVPDDDRQIEAAESRRTARTVVPFARLLASPVIWGTVIGTFCYAYFIYFSMTWLPAYFVERHHFSLADSSLYTGFSFLGMALVATLAGWVADRLIERGRDAVAVRKAFTIAGFLAASTELIGALSPSRSVAVFFAVFSLSGLGLTTANYWALTQTLFPGAAVGRIVGVQNCAANLSGIVAPVLTGWLVQTTGSYEAPMKAIWIFLLTGVLSYLVLVQQRYAPQPQPPAARV